MRHLTTTTESELKIFTEEDYNTYIITDGNNFIELGDDIKKLEKFLKTFEAQFAYDINAFAKMYSEFELPKPKLSGFAKYIADGGRIWD